MPLYREWNSDPYSLAAIWRIEEQEAFFIEKTGIPSDIRNEKRRIERLAGRFLLKYLKEDFPLHHIYPDEHDKPRLLNKEYFFSISHSYPYVAAIVSPYVECGIDIQVWHRRMVVLQHKFLSPGEQLFFNNDPRLLTLGWSNKEAVYKWQGRRGVEFVDHLIISEFAKNEENYNMLFNLQLTVPKMQISTKSFMDNDFACAYVVHDHIFHPIF